MQPENPLMAQPNAAYAPALARNRVLRNTYLLLATSMVPTVIGAWLGVQLQFTFFAGHPAIGFMLFLAIAFGFMFGIERTRTAAGASCSCSPSRSSWACCSRACWAWCWGFPTAPRSSPWRSAAPE